MSEGLVSAIIAVIALIAWFVRLEAMSNMNSKDILRADKRQDEHEKKLDELDNRVMDKLSNIERLVAKIEGSLSK